jgi:hypothetical protein
MLTSLQIQRYVLAGFVGVVSTSMTALWQLFIRRLVLEVRLTPDKQHIDVAHYSPLATVRWKRFPIVALSTSVFETRIIRHAHFESRQHLLTVLHFRNSLFHSVKVQG